MALKDLTGQKFGRLTVIERAPTYVAPSGQRLTKWKYLCECGNFTIKTPYDLKETSRNPNSFRGWVECE